MLWRIIILLLLVILVGRAIWRLVGGIVEGASSLTGGQREPHADARMVKDPVCGTYVVPSRALTASRGAETAWFCSPECQRTWQRRSVRVSRG